MNRQPTIRKFLYEDARTGKQVVANGKWFAGELLGISAKQCRNYVNILGEVKNG
jgi:hypothetical protein